MGNKLSRSVKQLELSFLKLLSQYGIIVAMVLATAIMLYAKCRVSMYPTQDVVGYVFNWMQGIKDVGISNFYTVDADYSPMFLFIVSIFTLLPSGEMITVRGYEFFSNWMIYLKSFYFVLDILNAIAIFLIIKHITKDKVKAAIGYLVAVILPVQFINSAVWGNADSLYACFLLYCIYFVLKDKGSLAMFFFGLALANKLQALFLAPFIVYLLLNRKVKLSRVIFVPAAILTTFIPAYVCGAGFTEPFGFFTKQVGGYSKLTLGCPNFWQLFAFRDEETIAKGAPVFALAAIGALFAIVFFRYIRQTDENLIAVAAFLVGITVFFLPHMHERYYYLLDLLVLVYAITRGKNYFLIPIMQLASGIAYYHYISGRYFIDPWGEDSVHIAAVAVIAVLSFIFADVMKSEHIGIKGAVINLERELEEIS